MSGRWCRSPSSYTAHCPTFRSWRQKKLPQHPTQISLGWRGPSRAHKHTAVQLHDRVSLGLVMSVFSSASPLPRRHVLRGARRNGRASGAKASANCKLLGQALPGSEGAPGTSGIRPRAGIVLTFSEGAGFSRTGEVLSSFQFQILPNRKVTSHVQSGVARLDTARFAFTSDCLAFAVIGIHPEIRGPEMLATPLLLLGLVVSQCNAGNWEKCSACLLQPSFVGRKMYIYIHIYIYTHVYHKSVHICKYIHTLACIVVCMYACMYVCMYARMCACMYACMYACMHACMLVCVQACMYL